MNMLKKVLMIITAALLIIVAGVGAFFGRLYINPNKFIRQVDESGVYYNTSENKIPQTMIYNVIHNHFFYNSSGKIPKLLFVGYDGCIVNAVPYHENY